MSDSATALSLTRAGWSGEDTAWETLVASQFLLTRAVSAALAGYPEYRDRADALESEVLLDRAECAFRQRGLETGDAPLRDPEGWLFRVFRNAAVSRLRGWRRRDRRLVERDLGHLPAPPTSACDPASVREAEAALNALPSRYHLAWVSRNAPEYLDWELVWRASTPERRGPSGVRGGLARDPESTWEALEAWRARHGDRVSSRAARRELAWVLRSDSTDSPEVWCRESPEEVRRALDTVGTWERRARERLRRAG